MRECLGECRTSRLLDSGAAVRCFAKGRKEEEEEEEGHCVLIECCMKRLFPGPADARREEGGQRSVFRAPFQCASSLALFIERSCKQPS